MILNGSVTFSSSGAVTDNTGFAVDVDNHDSNNVTFSGNITSTGTGIRVQNCGGGTKTFSGGSKSLNTGANSGVTLTSNTGATITISGGGLVITTTSGTGFNATGGATAVNVTGSGNTISSPTGTALNVNATTIGASGLTFQSISSANSAAPDGIILDNTGSSGGLTVTGDGSNTSLGGNSSGGTITNKTGSDLSTTTGIGIYLNNTKDVVLRRMTIGSNQNHGIRGLSVTNFTLEYSTFNGTNGTNPNNNGYDQYGEGCIVFGNQSTSGLTGTGTITSCLISGGSARNLSIVNPSGTLNRVTISGCNFGHNGAGGNGSLSLEARSGATLNATVQSCTFTGSPGDASNFTGQQGTSMDIIYGGVTATPGTGLGNVITNNHPNNNIGGSNITLGYQWGL